MFFLTPSPYDMPCHHSEDSALLPAHLTLARRFSLGILLPPSGRAAAPAASNRPRRQVDRSLGRRAPPRREPARGPSAPGAAREEPLERREPVAVDSVWSGSTGKPVFLFLLFFFLFFWGGGVVVVVFCQQTSTPCHLLT